eukprot:5914671-Prymnesium_polylepis.1
MKPSKRIETVKRMKPLKLKPLCNPGPSSSKRERDARPCTLLFFLFFPNEGQQTSTRLITPAGSARMSEPFRSIP